jgi:SOS-response transcriptional repressor LexA
MEETDMPTKWLTVKQIATDLGYNSPSTIRGRLKRLIEDKQLVVDMGADKTYRISETSYLKAKEAGVFDVKQRRVPRGTERPENLKPKS